LRHLWLLPFGEFARAAIGARIQNTLFGDFVQTTFDLLGLDIYGC